MSLTNMLDPQDFGSAVSQPQGSVGLTNILDLEHLDSTITKF